MKKIKTNPVAPLVKGGLYLYLMLATIPCLLHAQDIDFSVICPNPAHTFTGVTANVAISPAITINALNTGGASATMSIQYVGYDEGFGEIPDCFLPPCTSPYLIFGVTIDTSGGIVSIEGTPENDAAGKSIIFTIRATAGGTNCDRTFILPIVRQPVDLMLVLDNSPSMNCCTDIDDPTCVSCADPTKEVRMTKLKEAVDVFFTLGASGGYFLPDDHFGAVIFSGILDVSQSTYTTNPGSLNTYIQGIGTSGGTCLGGGLLEAIDQMTAQSQPNRRKSLILFTDGEQNYNPMLLENLLVPVEFESGNLPVSSYDPANPNPPYGTCMTFPASTPVFNSSFRDNTPGIKISTIGFKLPPGPVTTLLSNLANDVSGPGGTTNVGISGDPFDFNTFFTNAFTELLSGSSPQLVQMESEAVQDGAKLLKFIVNDTVTKISFILVGDDIAGNNIRFGVLKDDVNVTRLGRIVDKETYRLWHIDFPVKRAPDLMPGGLWTLETSDSLGAGDFQATCIVDDHYLDYECSFGDPAAHSPGNEIPIKVALNYKGEPVVDAEEIKVIIERSIEDGGTMLATLPVPQNLHTILTREAFAEQEIDPAYNNLGQLKHYALIKTNPSYVNALKGIKDEIILDNNLDGTYSGVYVPSVTGAHNFTFLIKGQRSDIGRYYRTSMKSSAVKINDIDLSEENFELEVLRDGDVVYGYKFTMTVKDNAGLLLGPAFGTAFNLKTSSGEYRSVRDNLDGSYTVILNDTGDPEISLSINDQELFKGNASEFGKDEGPDYLKKWWFWVGAVVLVAIIIWRSVK